MKYFMCVAPAQSKKDLLSRQREALWRTYIVRQFLAARGRKNKKKKIVQKEREGKKKKQFLSQRGRKKMNNALK